MSVAGWLGGAGVGAGLMYLFDPQAGGRRRALVRDQMVHLGRVAQEAADAGSRDLLNRVSGTLAELGGAVVGRGQTDEALRDRVLTRLHVLVRHPHALEVQVHEGRVTLTGPVLADEVERLLLGISAIRGVPGVENRLQVHESAEGVPALQGVPSRRWRPDGDGFRGAEWPTSTRVVGGVVGGVLALWGAGRRDVVGALVALAGTALLARAAGNVDLARLTGLATLG